MSDYGKITDDLQWSHEAGVLGSLMRQNDLWDEVESKLRIGLFVHTDTIAIYHAVSGLLATGKPADVITVAEWLDGKGWLGRQVGFDILTSVAQAAAVTTALARRYLDMLANAAMIRDAQSAIAEFADSLLTADARQDAAPPIQHAAGKLEDIANAVDGADTHTMTANEIAMMTIERIESAMAGKPLPAIPTGFADLDRVLCGGFYPGDLIIVAGRPAMGKTALAMCIADAVACLDCVAGGHVLICSMEMGPDQLGPRQMAANARINLDKIRTGNLDPDDLDKLTVATMKLSDMRQTVDFRAALAVQQVRAKAKKLARLHKGLAAIVIDYLQLMQAKSDNRNNEIGEITRGLKALAKEIGCPVIALSQLNRGVESRNNKRPMMSDLRESGSIEQDADTILMLYRDEYYTDDSPYKGTAEVIVAKQRMGESGKAVHLAFRGEFSRMDTLEQGWRPPEITKPTQNRWGDDL